MFVRWDDGCIGIHYSIGFTLYVFEILHDTNLKKFLGEWESERLSTLAGAIEVQRGWLLGL